MTRSWFDMEPSGQGPRRAGDLHCLRLTRVLAGVVALACATVVPPVLSAARLAYQAQKSTLDVSATYILGQAICLPESPKPPKPQLTECVPQHVGVGAIVEIQLPGTPSVWTVASMTGQISPIGQPTRLPSPGRIDGTSEIYRFRFHVNQPGTAQIKIAETPPFLALPSGAFTYTMVIP